MWYASNAPLVAAYGDRVTRRAAEWDARWWSPIIAAEHLALRERAGIVDLSTFAIFDVGGPGAAWPTSSGCASTGSTSRSGGRSTRRCSTRTAGIVADLTVMHVGRDLYRVVTGGGMGMRDKKWFTDRLPAGRDAPSSRTSPRRGPTSACGVRARATSSPPSRRADVSNAAFPFGTCR